MIAAVLLTVATAATVAFASDVDVAIVDVTVPTTEVTLAPGESSAIKIDMTVTGNQSGTATFEVYRTWTLSAGSFVGSNPQEFTVGPRGGGDPATTFSTSGTVVVPAGHAPGTFNLAVSAFDITNTNTTGAKLGVGDASNYQVIVGNAAPVDTTPPVIVPIVTGTLGMNGWYTSNVGLSWSVNDDESAVTSKVGCDPTSIVADQQPTDYTCTATSQGGTDSQTVSIKRDTAAPTNVAFNSDVPADGGRYFPNNVPAGNGCTAGDATSGVASCVVTGRSTAVGTHTLTATATDNAGHTATATRTYSVRVLTLSGFFNPVDMGGVVNTVKGGSTVPLKFTVADEGVPQTATSVVKSFSQRLVTCGTLAGVTDDIEIVTTGGTSLRYDATAGQFIQNWQTPKNQVGACYIATVTMIDDSTIAANFKLK